MAPADPTLDINMQLWVAVTMPLNFWHCNDKKVSALYLLHALYLHDTSSNYYFLFLRLVFICFPWGTIAWRFLHINFLNFAVGGRTKLGHGLLSGKYSIPVAEVWLFQEKKYWMHIPVHYLKFQTTSFRQYIDFPILMIAEGCCNWRCCKILIRHVSNFFSILTSE